MSGFLRGWLRRRAAGDGLRLRQRLRRHRRLAPRLRAGDADLAGAGLFPQGQDRPRRLRDDTELEHLHWATTRRPDYPQLYVLAMDHRSQFEDLARDLGADEARIEGFKALALAAVHKVAAGDPSFGLLLDGRFGQRGLEAAADYPYWLGRPIERPGSRPLEFEGRPRCSSELARMAAAPGGQVPGPLPSGRRREPEVAPATQLIRLADACRQTRHEFLLEIIASRAGPVDATTVRRAMEQIYALGVRPDWWKLEPAADPAAWVSIARTIQARDPLCRGVVLLGQSAQEEALVAAFQAAAGVDIVKGFAVGRTIFAEPARLWLTGAIDDAEATAGSPAISRGWSRPGAPPGPRRSRARRRNSRWPPHSD